MDIDRSGSSRGADFESMRPNADQYKENFWENRERDYQEYKEFAEKAGMDTSTNKFKESFETMYDIRDIKFRPDDVAVPDPSGRDFFIYHGLKQTH